MQTRSTILGKRGHQDSSSVSPASSFCEQLQTPDNTPNPKRARIATVVVDGDSNKENIPPFNSITPIHTDISPRAVRALRRNATESVVGSTRGQARKYLALVKRTVSYLYYQFDDILLRRLLDLPRRLLISWNFPSSLRRLAHLHLCFLFMLEFVLCFVPPAIVPLPPLLDAMWNALLCSNF